MKCGGIKKLKKSDEIGETGDSTTINPLGDDET